MAFAGMAYIGMAIIVMAFAGMAYIGMAIIVMAHREVQRHGGRMIRRRRTQVDVARGHPLLSAGQKAVAITNMLP